MSDRYEALDSPFSIGKVQIKNRFVMAPTTTGSYLAPDGSFSKEGIEYFVRRAQGGMGLVQTGALMTDYKIDAPGALGPMFMATPESQQAFIVSSDALLNRLEAYGAKMFIQISAGLGRNSPGSYGPSANPYFGTTDQMNPVLTTDQIKQKIQMMVDAATARGRHTARSRKASRSAASSRRQASMGSMWIPASMTASTMPARRCI